MAITRCATSLHMCPSSRLWAQAKPGQWKNWLAARSSLFHILDLARPKVLSCPKRSIIADTVTEIKAKEDLTTYLECYVVSLLKQGLLCRRLGITPWAFWDLQTLEKFEWFQKAMDVKMLALYERPEDERERLKRERHRCKRDGSSNAPEIATKEALQRHHPRLRSNDTSDDESISGFPVSSTGAQVCKRPPLPLTDEGRFGYVDKYVSEHRNDLISDFEKARQDLAHMENSSRYIDQQEPAVF